MKPQKEKKEKESFWNALIIYGFIAIALIGFLGYMYGSIAIGTMFIIAPLLFKGAGTSKDGMFTKSPTNKVKDVWQGASKKKKAGIVAGIVALLPFVILGVLWLAMIGAMFAVDLLFILPIILIILWFWFRTPSHQTFAGSASLGHPAVLGVAVIIIVVIAIVSTENYMSIHQYDGVDVKDTVKLPPEDNATTLTHQDTDHDGIPDYKDPDIDGDGIPNDVDIDINGNGKIDNYALYQNYTDGKLTANEKENVTAQLNKIIQETGSDIVYFENGNVAYRIKPSDIGKTYDVKIKFYDPYAADTLREVLSKTIYPKSGTQNNPNCIPQTTPLNITQSDRSNISTICWASVVYAETPLSGYAYTSVPYTLVSILSEENGRVVEKYRAEADSQGEVTLHGMKAGVYTLSISGGGYQKFLTNITVCNKTASGEIIVYMRPSYLRLEVDAELDSKTTSNPDYIANIIFSPNYTLHIRADWDGMTKIDKIIIDHQNRDYGWSGVPTYLGGSSARSKATLEMMFNTMATGLNDMYLSGVYQKTTLHPEYVKDNLVLLKTGGSEIGSNSHLHVEYKLWHKTATAVRPNELKVMLHFTTYFKASEGNNNSTTEIKNDFQMVYQPFLTQYISRPLDIEE